MSSYALQQQDPDRRRAWLLQQQQQQRMRSGGLRSPELDPRQEEMMQIQRQRQLQQAALLRAHATARGSSGSHEIERHILLSVLAFVLLAGIGVAVYFLFFRNRGGTDGQGCSSGTASDDPAGSDEPVVPSDSNFINILQSAPYRYLLNLYARLHTTTATVIYTVIAVTGISTAALVFIGSIIGHRKTLVFASKVINWICLLAGVGIFGTCIGSFITFMQDDGITSAMLIQVRSVLSLVLFFAGIFSILHYVIRQTLKLSYDAEFALKGGAAFVIEYGAVNFMMMVLAALACVFHFLAMYRTPESLNYMQQVLADSGFIYEPVQPTDTPPMSPDDATPAPNEPTFSEYISDTILNYGLRSYSYVMLSQAFAAVAATLSIVGFSLEQLSFLLFSLVMGFASASCIMLTRFTDNWEEPNLLPNGWGSHDLLWGLGIAFAVIGGISLFTTLGRLVAAQEKKAEAKRRKDVLEQLRRDNIDADDGDRLIDFTNIPADKVDPKKHVLVFEDNKGKLQPLIPDNYEWDIGTALNNMGSKEFNKPNFDAFKEEVRTRLDKVRNDFKLQGDVVPFFEKRPPPDSFWSYMFGRSRGFSKRRAARAKRL